MSILFSKILNDSFVQIRRHVVSNQFNLLYRHALRLFATNVEAQVKLQDTNTIWPTNFDHDFDSNRCIFAINAVFFKINTQCSYSKPEALTTFLRVLHHHYMHVNQITLKFKLEQLRT